MKSLVIIPTYNEAENISNLVPALYALLPLVHILVVDDNSPDGTGGIVSELTKKYHGLHLLSRPGKQGLGKAYLAGFQWGIQNQFDHFIEMDADFSHRPEDLVRIIETFTKDPKVDVVVGSRYVEGGKTVNWGILRKLISRGGGFYSRMILGYPLQDWTGGFNGWKKTVLQGIGLETVTSEGYSFQIELKYKALRKGFHIQEVPITFEDRRVGQSKMSFKIVIEAFWKVWKIKLKP